MAERLTALYKENTQLHAKLVNVQNAFEDMRKHYEQKLAEVQSLAANQQKSESRLQHSDETVNQLNEAIQRYRRRVEKLKASKRKRTSQFAAVLKLQIAENDRLKELLQSQHQPPPQNPIPLSSNHITTDSSDVPGRGGDLDAVDTVSEDSRIEQMRRELQNEFEYRIFRLQQTHDDELTRLRVSLEYDIATLQSELDRYRTSAESHRSRQLHCRLLPSDDSPALPTDVIASATSNLGNETAGDRKLKIPTSLKAKTTTVNAAVQTKVHRKAEETRSVSTQTTTNTHSESTQTTTQQTPSVNSDSMAATPQTTAATQPLALLQYAKQTANRFLPQHRNQPVEYRDSISHNNVSIEASAAVVTAPSNMSLTTSQRPHSTGGNTGANGSIQPRTVGGETAPNDTSLASTSASSLNPLHSLDWHTDPLLLSHSRLQPQPPPQPATDMRRSDQPMTSIPKRSLIGSDTATYQRANIEVQRYGSHVNAADDFDNDSDDSDDSNSDTGVPKRFGASEAVQYLSPRVPTTTATLANGSEPNNNQNADYETGGPAPIPSPSPQQLPRRSKTAMQRTESAANDRQRRWQLMDGNEDADSHTEPHSNGHRFAADQRIDEAEAGTTDIGGTRIPRLQWPATSTRPPQKPKQAANSRTHPVKHGPTAVHRRVAANQKPTTPLSAAVRGDSDSNVRGNDNGSLTNTTRRRKTYHEILEETFNREWRTTRANIRRSTESAATRR